MSFNSGWYDRSGAIDDRLAHDPLVRRMVGGAVCVSAALAITFLLWGPISGDDADETGSVQPNARVASAQPMGGSEEDGESEAIEQMRPNLRVAAAHEYAELAAGLKAYAHKISAMKQVASRAYDPIFDRHLLGPATATFVSAALPQEPDAEATQSPMQRALQAAITGSTTPATRDTVKDSAPLKTASAAPTATAPAPRTNHLAPTIRNASISRDAARANANVADASSDAQADKPSFFERLFGKPKPLTLAYAAPEDGTIDDNTRGIIAGRYDRQTAVYDISAHRVYLPNGVVLEAHSGRGADFDDPRHTSERMQGPTPVNVYDLKMRESLFHGVEAIRLIPQNDDKVFGRSGFLAHTFMLGARGDSFGCVSFRNYEAFLQAYKRGEIKHLAVVASL
jgi:hypothetical protein